MPPNIDNVIELICDLFEKRIFFFTEIIVALRQRHVVPASARGTLEHNLGTVMT